MKRKIIIVIFSIVILIISSCEGPDALVINIVHTDGSVTRKIILTYTKDEFNLDKCQIPVDSTWNITRDYDISEKGDTTFTLTALKEFESVEEINNLYVNYKGSNPGMKRKVLFKKKFRWFNTVYMFTEHVSKAMNGYPPEDFFPKKELDYFYMPDKLVEARLMEADSNLIKETIIEPMEEKYDIWLGRSLVKVLVDKMADTVRVNPGLSIDTSILYNMEEEIAAILFDEMDEEEVLDSLMGEGFYESNRALLDTLTAEVEEEFDVAFNADNYLIQTIMPGELIATNGFVDEDRNVLWEVKGDVILSADYEMWAESKTGNLWAWIITGIFVLFVISGFIVRIFKR